jgi:hypothetical protein
LGDVDLLEEAKTAAQALLAADPDLSTARAGPLAAAVRRRLEGRARLASVG